MTLVEMPLHSADGKTLLRVNHKHNCIFPRFIVKTYTKITKYVNIKRVHKMPRKIVIIQLVVLSIWDDE